MEEGDAEVDTAGDKEVEGRDGEATVDVVLDTDAANDLAWNVDDPYLKIDDETLGAHQTPMAMLTPLLMSTKETLPLCPMSPSIERPHREIPAPEPAAVDDSVPGYSDVPLVEFTRPELT